MLNSTEYELSSAHKKTNMLKNKIVFPSKLADDLFIILINVNMPTISNYPAGNVKMPTTVGNLIVISTINSVHFMLN